jgi:alpha-tubulin suppressor-like RCC1 family protein
MWSPRLVGGYACLGSISRRLLYVLAPALLLAALGCGEDATSPGSDPEAAPGAAPTLATAAATALSFSSVSAGVNHTCGIATDGRAYCWGSNTSGQLGDGTRTMRLRPVPVAGGLHFLELRAGDGHTCGIATDSRAYCWGSGGYGQLGDGTTTSTQLSPVAVAGGRKFRSISAGRRYTCAVNFYDVAFCSGDNTWGQLGIGSGPPYVFFSTTPVRVLGGLHFRRVNAGASHTCGATTDDRGYCWGHNSTGELGDGSSTNRTKPVAVAGGRRFRQVLPGSGFISDAGDPNPDDAYSCGVSTDDKIYCWGLSAFGSFGGTATPISGTRRWLYVNLGATHICGLTYAGAAFCWGYNYVGQLGNGTTTSSYMTQVRVSGGLTFSGLSTSPLGQHTCGLTIDHRAYCWGYNISGQLGDGTRTNRLTPTAVLGPS